MYFSKEIQAVNLKTTALLSHPIPFPRRDLLTGWRVPFQTIVYTCTDTYLCTCRCTALAFVCFT